MDMLGQYVLVTTRHRGVFAGVLSRQEGEVVTLTEARNCTFWSRPMRGFLGLAKMGPDTECRIGESVPSLILYGVTSVALCTEAARKRWEAAPWS